MSNQSFLAKPRSLASEQEAVDQQKSKLEKRQEFAAYAKRREEEAHEALRSAEAALAKKQREEAEDALFAAAAKSRAAREQVRNDESKQQCGCTAYPCRHTAAISGDARSLSEQKVQECYSPKVTVTSSQRTVSPVATVTLSEQKQKCPVPVAKTPAQVQPVFTFRGPPNPLIFQAVKHGAKPREAVDNSEIFPTTSNPFDSLSKRTRTKHAKFEAKRLEAAVESAMASQESTQCSQEPESNVGSELPLQYQDESYSTEYSHRRLKCHKINGYRVGENGLWYAPDESLPIPQAPPMAGGFRQNQQDLAVRRHRARVEAQRVRDSERLVGISPFTKRKAQQVCELMVSRHLSYLKPAAGAPKVEWIPTGLGFRDSGGGAPLVSKKEICDDQIVEHHERRVLAVGFKRYKFPYLDFIGYWNSSPYSQGTKVFTTHWGVHIHQDDIEVDLPATLVDELVNFWNHKQRDAEEREFAVSASKARKLCSEMGITAEQQRTATLYGPAVAYLDSWGPQQNVSRVVSKAYVHSGVMTTIAKVKRAWAGTQGKAIIIGGALSVALAIGGVAYLASRLLRKSEPQLYTGPWLPELAPRKKTGAGIDRPFASRHQAREYWEARAGIGSSYDPEPLRLVGIELNPGPAGQYPNAPRWCPKCKATSPKACKCAHISVKGMDWSTIKVKPLTNCARLLRPKHLKPGAWIRLQDGELRENLHFKDPEEKRGKHCTFGFDTKRYEPVAFASNQHNEEQALYARVLADTVQPDPAKLAECIQWCKDNHSVLFPMMHKVKSVSPDEYLERSNASPSVKRILKRTFDQLKKDGIDEESKLSSGQLYEFTTRSSFVKVENNLYQSPLGEKDKAPRLIQGARPEFICLVGPWIMALQDLLKRRWNVKKSNLVFTSGVKSEDAAAFIADGVGAILEDDLGKFDCSIRRPWCEYEVWLCRRFGAPRAVLDLMTANIKTHGITLHGWRYKCEGTRKSGDPYTSLMNSIINGLSHLFLYCSWTGRSAEEARKTIRMLLQGDDNLMRHVEKRRFDWKVGMGELGFDSEAIYRDHLDEAEFCSNRLYHTTGGWVFGPKPGKVLAKMGYVINPPVGVQRESLMRGVAIGLRKSCNHIPPIRVVLDRVLELTKGHDAWFERKFLEHTMKMRDSYESTVDIELSLADQYDWDAGKQKLFAANVSRLQLGDAYNDPFADLLFDRDTSGPQRIFCSAVAA